MESYVALINYTLQGIQNFKDAADRVNAARAAIEAAGGKMISFYLTMGPYDAVAVIEVPDAQTGAAISIRIAAQGNIRLSTMRAFTEAETAQLAASVG